MAGKEAKYVLVVDDDPFYSNIYETKLKKEGIPNRIVNDGDTALKIMRESLPALVVLDLIMPGKDGFQTLTEIKADPALKEAMVIVLSNLNQEEDRQRVLDLGATAYYVKAELSLEDMVNIVKKHLA